MVKRAHTTVKLALVFGGLLAVSACASIEETERYKAAEAGNTAAQVELASDFLEGDQVQFIKQDLNRAAEWYLRAAELGNATAQNQIANMYLAGTGVDVDAAQAAKWHGAAAEQGVVNSQVQYGRMLIDGHGIEQDAKKGIEMLAKGAEATGDTALEREIGMAYLEGRGVDKDVPTATEWLAKVGEKGDLRAQFELGKLFYNGTEVQQDKVAAEYWLRRPAQEANYPLAQYLLGTLYRDGHGVPQEYALALDWFDAAGQQGHVKSLQEMAELYYGGKGTSKDLADAHMWLNIASTITKVDSAYSEEDASRIRSILEARRDEIGGMLETEELSASQRQAYNWWQDNRTLVLENEETLAMFDNTL